MAIRRLFLSVTAVAAAGLLTAVATTTPSSAQPNYPPAGTSVTVSSSTATVGETITLSGEGFLPNSVVTITSEVTGGPTALAPLTGGPEATGSSPVQARVISAALVGGAAHRESGSPRQGLDTRCSTGETCHVRVDAEGNFSVPFTFTRVGATEIIVTGQNANGDPAADTVTVQVNPAAGTGEGRPGKGGLAFTGAPVLGGAAAGLVLVLVGSGLLLGFRRRRRDASVD
ncbi:MAG TPA: hypothetical protein VIS06_06975 [Mycobacteriales bacterium]